MAIPLAWTIVILCARALVLRLRAASTRVELALGVALLATLTDVNLEAIAWKVRGYWRWYPDARAAAANVATLAELPLVVWTELCARLYLLPRNDVLRPRDHAPGPAPRRCWVLMNALFVVVYLARWVPSSESDRR